ncbi:hypothetical protein AB0912_14035 [Streptomyces sp. NPDC007084]|uniref:hypothetical protein n=1 Tax=Streptomyces sp. NPDC007084 TaxID=3154313 RepID=UPI0034535C86
MAQFAAPPPRTDSAPLVLQPLRRRHCAERRSGPLALLVLAERARLGRPRAVRGGGDRDVGARGGGR